MGVGTIVATCFKKVKTKQAEPAVKMHISDHRSKKESIVRGVVNDRLLMAGYVCVRTCVCVWSHANVCVCVWSHANACVCVCVLGLGVCTYVCVCVCVNVTGRCLKNLQTTNCWWSSVITSTSVWRDNCDLVVVINLDSEISHQRLCSMWILKLQLWCVVTAKLAALHLPLW